MSPDAFRRLALLVSCSASVGVLVSIWLLVSPWAALAVGLGGPALSLLVTLEERPERAKPREREGLSRREIARRHPPVGDLE